MRLIIIVSIILTVVAIGAYQLVINRYYWGPNGPPKKSNRDNDKS